MTKFVLIFLLVLGAALRLHGLFDYLPFWSDSAVDLLIAERIWDSTIHLNFGNLPLTGPVANTYLDSSSSIGHGIAYYYLLTVPAVITNFSPYGLAILVITLNVAAIFLLFVLIKQIFDQKTALIGSFLLATSNYSIQFSRISWNVNWIVFFVVSSLLTFTKILQGRLVYWPLFSFLVSVLTQIHILGYLFVLITFLPLILLRRVILPKGKLVILSVLLFLVPQLPLLIFFLKHQVFDKGTLIQYLISTAGDLSNFGFLVFLVKYLSANFIFANQLSSPTIYLFLILFFIIVSHLTLNKWSKLAIFGTKNVYLLLLLSWSCSTIIILFLSKSHLERGNNYILVFILPLFIMLSALFLSYAFGRIKLIPPALIILVIYLFANFTAIGKFQTLTLEDHQQLARYLKDTNSSYELSLPEAAIQESIYWTLAKAGTPLPERVNGQPKWILPLTKYSILLNNYPTAKKYAVVYVDTGLVPSGCSLDRRFGALSLYLCNLTKDPTSN